MGERKKKVEFRHAYGMMRCSTLISMIRLALVYSNGKPEVLWHEHVPWLQTVDVTLLLAVIVAGDDDWVRS
jgi:hypothetical protein